MEKIDVYDVDLSKIDENSTLVVAGVRRGKFIKEFLKLSIPVRIIGIDALQTNLDRHVGKFPDNVELYNFAITGGLQSSRISFNKYEGDVGKSSIAPLHTNPLCNLNTSNHEKVEVEAITLRTLCDRLTIKQIDYLRLDIEGAEHDIFTNMSQDTASRIKQFGIEIHPNDMLPLDYFRDVRSTLDLLTNMLDLGFSVKKIADNIVYGWR